MLLLVLRALELRGLGGGAFFLWSDWGRGADQRVSPPQCARVRSTLGSSRNELLQVLERSVFPEEQNQSELYGLGEGRAHQSPAPSNVQNPLVLGVGSSWAGLCEPLWFCRTPPPPFNKKILEKFYFIIPLRT